MPSTAGGWTPNASANARMRLVVEWDTPPSPSPGQTSVSVPWRVVGEVGYSVNDTDNTFQVGGSLGASRAAGSVDFIIPSNGRRVLASGTATVSIGASAGSRTVTASITGIQYVGGSRTATVSASIPIPAQTSVAAPTNVRIERVSLARIRVTWDGGPIHDLRVRRLLTAGASDNDWRDFEPLGTTGQARSSGVEYDVSTGFEWQASVRRQAGSLWSQWIASSNRARLFNVPSAPTSMSRTVASATRADLAWVYPSGGQPVERFVIQRHDYSTGNWSNIATVAGNARSYRDMGITANGMFRHRIAAVNAAGSSVNNGGWTLAPEIRTTPAHAVDVQAMRTGPNTAQVSWTVDARWGTEQALQAQTSADGGITWSAWVLVPGHEDFGAGVTSRTVTGLDPELLHRFRIRTGAIGAESFYSWSAASGIIRPAAKPNPPTVLAPTGVVSSLVGALARWRYQPTDGGTQTSYELRYRQGGDWTTLTGTSATQRDLDLLAVGTYEMQVRTRGQHPDWSDWSTSQVFEVLNPPSVQILEPADGGSIGSNRLRMLIGYADDTGAAMLRYRAELLDAAGAVLESRTGTGLTVAFTRELTNHTDYQVRVWVTSGTGLESAPAVAGFGTDFLLPTRPVVAAQWIEPEGVARLAITNRPEHDGIAVTHTGDGEWAATQEVIHVGEGVWDWGVPVTHLEDGVWSISSDPTVDADHNRIERSLDLGQTWTAVADDLPLDVGYDDWMVPLNQIVWYRAVAVSHLGTEASSEHVEVETESGRVWLAGDGGQQMFGITLDIALQPSYGHERVSEMYYGRAKPVTHYGAARPVTIGITGNLAHDYGLGDDPTVMLGQDLWYRDPVGRAFWASITDGIQLPQTSNRVQGISLSVEEVDVEA